MRVVVCGSRCWSNRAAIRRELEQLPPGTRVAHGGCGQDARGRFLWGRPDAEAEVGADMLAGAVAAELGFEVVRYIPPEWLAGNFVGSAGPRRNSRMLTEERPDLVLAFTTDLAASRGTADCCRKATRMGVEVRVIGEERMRTELNDVRQIINDMRAVWGSGATIDTKYVLLFREWTGSLRPKLAVLRLPVEFYDEDTDYETDCRNLMNHVERVASEVEIVLKALPPLVRPMY